MNSKIKSNQYSFLWPAFILKCVFKKLLIGKKTFKEKMNRKSNNKQFFSEELLQEIFSNLHVDQYNLLSHFTKKEKNHVKKGELLLLCLSCIFK